MYEVFQTRRQNDRAIEIQTETLIEKKTSYETEKFKEKSYKLLPKTR